MNCRNKEHLLVSCEQQLYTCGHWQWRTAQSLWKDDLSLHWGTTKYTVTQRARILGNFIFYKYICTQRKYLSYWGYSMAVLLALLSPGEIINMPGFWGKHLKMPYASLTLEGKMKQSDEASSACHTCCALLPFCPSSQIKQKPCGWICEIVSKWWVKSAAREDCRDSEPKSTWGKNCFNRTRVCHQVASQNHTSKYLLLRQLQNKEQLRLLLHLSF